jgi:hypothetical protein
MEAVDRTPGLVRSRGMEVGLRTEAIPKNQTAISLYRLDFASELTYIGDAGNTEAGAPSRRVGIEFSNYYKPYKWLSLDFDAAFARARAGPSRGRTGFRARSKASGSWPDGQPAGRLGRRAAAALFRAASAARR